MIYRIILEIPQEMINEEILNTVVLWEKAFLSRYVIYSVVNNGIFLAPVPSNIKSVLNLRDNLSKVLNWQLLQSKYYLISWITQLEIIKEKYPSMIDYVFIKTYDVKEESKLKESMKCLEKWNNLKRGKKDDINNT